MTTILLRLCIICYSSILAAGMMVLRLTVSRAPFAKAWNLAERSAGPRPAHGDYDKETVWIHAASLGESKILVRFLDILRKKHPGQWYLLTATTRTGVEYLRQRFAGGDDDDIAAIGFLPVDTVRRMRMLIKTFRVQRVWVMETELWPSLLWTCMRMSVPLGLVNARIEERSLASYRRMAWLLNGLLCFPDIVLAQNETYAGRFAQLGIPTQRIRVTGNMKSYVTVRPMPAVERAKLRSALFLDNNEFCLTAGCLHAGEGTVLRKAIDKVKAAGLSVKCIVVPRYLSESASLSRELGPGAVVLSEPAAGASGWGTCIIDKMGVLDAMYRIADAAFIGGTFDTTGGHNMWDAAQFGIPVLFGPDFHTQQESGKTLLAAGVGFRAETAEELADLLLAVLRKADAREQFLRSRDVFMDKINLKSNTMENIIP
jgi:3-deoxy-D-manno-octulosonic-acid transferase